MTITLLDTARQLANGDIIKAKCWPQQGRILNELYCSYSRLFKRTRSSAALVVYCILTTTFPPKRQVKATHLNGTWSFVSRTGRADDSELFKQFSIQDRLIILLIHIHLLLLINIHSNFQYIFTYINLVFGVVSRNFNHIDCYKPFSLFFILNKPFPFTYYEWFWIKWSSTRYCTTF